MKHLLFDSWHQWKVCFLSGCKKFAWGLCRIVASIFFGMLSIIRYLWRKLVLFVGTYPVAAIVAAAAIVLFVWALTYVSGRARLADAEQQRDSLSYQLLRYDTIYEQGDVTYFPNDTITIYSHYDKP